MKYRRRREGKTDYARRRRLVIQDKTKYATHKYRLVVRFTNKDTICQIIYSKIQGDFVMAAAYGHELTRYGIPLGHTNYAAAYATGLLLARRVLKKLNLADRYQGNTEVNGEDYTVSPLGGNEPNPFRAFLDVGLARTSTGSKVFAALKGATDGGLNVPHSVSRFVGYNGESKKLEADILRKYIFGGHVADYMADLEEEDPGTYQSKFAGYLKHKLTHDTLEDTYTEAHAKIRANPDFVKGEKKSKPEEQKRWNKKKLTYKQRKANLAKRKVELGITV